MRRDSTLESNTKGSTNKSVPFAGLSTLCAIAWAAVVAGLVATAQADPPPTGYRADRILVKPKRGAELSALHRALGTRVLHSFPGIGHLEVVQLPQHAPVTSFLARFKQSGLVQYAEPDRIVYGLNEPNDLYYQQGYLWNLKNTGQNGGTAGADIKAPQAWNVQNTASNVIVAVIDVGALLTHEELALNLWTNPGEIDGNGIDDDGDGYVDDVHGINAIDDSGDPSNTDSTPVGGHGTHVSGIIGAQGNNTLGVVGVCWQVQIMECRFLHTQASQPYAYGYISDAIQCIDYARSKGANIINASWGDYLSSPFNDILPGLHDNPTNSSALHDAIASARDAGIIFVAAGGNDGTSNESHPLYPASYTDLDNVIAVAATDDNGGLAGFSNYGATTVHLGAPGQSVLSCWNGSDNVYYQWLSGTSMATPHVAGACALVWARYPTNSYQKIIRRVLTAVDPSPSLAGKSRTGSRLNLYRALQPNGDGTWTTTGNTLTTARYGHTATLLPDGQVLVAGGYNGNATGFLKTVELYDPANPPNGNGTWRLSPNVMRSPRFAATATLLRSGKVLVAGGFNSSGYLNTAELYDPSTDTWTATGNGMSTKRAWHTATLLSDGKVLVAGGARSSSQYVRNTDLYDPERGSNGAWTRVGDLTHSRYRAAATLLPDGSVLVAGGNDGSGELETAELYNPATTRWSMTASMATARDLHTTTLLPDGTVLAASGNTGTDGVLDPTAGLYNPAASPPGWFATHNLNVGRFFHTATALPNGQVLVVGGSNTPQGPIASAELYANGTWTLTAQPMSAARYLHTATLLPNGKVLVAGGYNDVAPLDSAELYDPIRF